MKEYYISKEFTVTIGRSIMANDDHDAEQQADRFFEGLDCAVIEEGIKEQFVHESFPDFEVDAMEATHSTEAVENGLVAVAREDAIVPVAPMANAVV